MTTILGREVAFVLRTASPRAYTVVVDGQYKLQGGSKVKIAEGPGAAPRAPRGK